MKAMEGEILQDQVQGGLKKRHAGEPIEILSLKCEGFASCECPPENLQNRMGTKL